jgi:hypothetical protein
MQPPDCSAPLSLLSNHFPCNRAISWTEASTVTLIPKGKAIEITIPTAIQSLFPVLTRARPLVERHGTGNASRIGDGEPATTTADRELIECHVARVIIKPQALKV